MQHALLALVTCLCAAHVSNGLPPAVGVDPSGNIFTSRITELLIKVKLFSFMEVFIKCQINSIST